MCVDPVFGASMEWHSDSVFCLIELYRSHPELWDVNHKDFRNRIKKHVAWTAISNEMGLQRCEIERKMRGLIGQFQREVRKQRNLQKLGELDDFYACKWFAFKSLLFLLDLKPFAGNLQDNDARISPLCESPGVIESAFDGHCFLQEDSITIKMEQSEDDGTSEEIAPTVEVTATPDPCLKKLPTFSRKRRGEDVAEMSHKLVKSEPDKKERDEFSIFGEYVACKIRCLSNKFARSTVEHHINTILYQADLGRYDVPDIPDIPHGAEDPAHCSTPTD